VKIQSNVAALNAQKSLGRTEGALGKSIGKLSSGYRINSASDDAAGMGIANKIRADIKALLQASRNASQATALVQVAEGAVGTISSILDRMKELSQQAASDSVTNTDRTKIDAEYQALSSEITRITDNTKYQGQALLNGQYGVSVAGGTAIAVSGTTGISAASGGSIALTNAPASTTYTIGDTAAGADFTLTAVLNGVSSTQTVTGSVAGQQTVNFDKLGVKLTLGSTYAAGGLSGMTIVTSAASGGSFQVGTTNNDDDRLSISFSNLSASGLSINTTSLTSLSNAQAASVAIDSAITTLNTTIGTIGAASNRFDYAIRNLQSLIENMGAAESVIRDADVGIEMTDFTKAQILQQAGTAMLAQANSAPQSVLSLLKG